MATQSRTTIVCDVSAIDADAGAIDALACLQLVARRHGLELRLRGASGELRDLLAFAGLAGVLRPEGASDLDSGFEPGR